MITKFDLKRIIKSKSEDELMYRFDLENEIIYDKNTNEEICSLDTYLTILRKENGQSFKYIYCDPASLIDVIQCTECGTVIHSHNDERYDPFLKCPTCVNYKTNFEYWTKKDIDSDINKKNMLINYEEINKYEREYDVRIKKRKGKYDWQIFKKNFNFRKKIIKLELNCYNITKSYFKGLFLGISIYKPDKETNNFNTFILNKSINIPLTPSGIYRKLVK